MSRMPKSRPLSLPRLLALSGCVLVTALAVAVGDPLGAAATTTRATPTPQARPSASPTLAPALAATQSRSVSATRVATPSPAPAATPSAAPVGTLTPALVAPQTSDQLDPPELRAVWVDAFHDGFKTSAQVDDLVAWARSANLNALFVQVRRRGDAYYLRSFEPRAEDPDLAPGFDALQYLIDRAHQGPQPLQVHAWLATLPIWWQRDTPPQAPNHPFNTRGLSAGPE